MSWDNIPNDLKQMNHWVCWRMALRKGKPTKQPVDARTGSAAESNNPETWSSYADAVAAVGRYNLTGIGFMFGGSGIVGVDVDHCRDAATGTMTPEIQHIIETLDSYTEYSQSGEGLHILCRGKLPEGRRRKGPFEMYDTGRYFVMTGALLDDAHATIEDRQLQLEQIHQLYVADDKKKKNEERRTPAEPVSLDDAELIRKAMSAANGPSFSQLWSGDITGYQSHSEADLALCNLLAFWTGCDESRMIALWRQSGLWREKCDEMHGERTYADITASKAAGDTTNTYSPPHARANQREVQPPPGMSWEQEPPPELSQKLIIHDDPPVPAVPDLHLATHDMGRAHRFAESIRGWALWCNDFNSWMIWNGLMWERDKKLQITTWAKGVIEKMVDDATRYHWRTRTDQSEEIMKKTMSARSERSIKSMINLARDEVAVTADAFDPDPYLLNCRTGIIDLRTGHQMQHNPEYMMTKCCHAGYASGTQWTLFGEFLETITTKDEPLQKYFQDVCGLAAIGKVLHEGMAIFFGSGRNGKSTYLNCISRVMGDYAGSINPEALINQRDGRQQAGGLSVMGKRLIIAQETEEGRKLSSQALKKLSSTDPITERPLYENERTFIPSHTLIMATNFLPRVGSTDDGTWRRIMVVPFRACIAEGAQIKGYADVMYDADRDAILAWIVDGAKRMLGNGCRLVPPQCVKDMTHSYKAAEDWMGNFLDECCTTGNHSVPGAEVYGAYTRWCEGNNEHPRRARDFAAALEARGFTKRKTMTCNMWDGLKVNVTESIDGFYGRYNGG